jgi:hypothetical protein
VTLKPHVGVLSGIVRPILPGAIVALQRQAGFRWANVATATVNDQGEYFAELDLAPGIYRARVAPRPGYAVGLSRTLSVSS